MMHKLIERARAWLGFMPAPPAPLSPAERLALTMKPNPDYRRRRLEHFGPERAARYAKNVSKIWNGDNIARP